MPALEAAMKITDRPCLIEFLVAREANVLPMIPAGGTADDMILELD
jgi:acetolactate synthase-1/2/3 large subunit